ncbi:serine/threonine-protein kinase [Tengunoibacter tsumagoiensis]|uniref:non-specific serine/threonine protein kinase n=1 Tax=Tengunoibacter tsumagoiensis TaxID=2014871 RepID=A0A402A5P3_9CHLR|nr:serine/threonine-protein kinase [Tengunoibacter tsumagoiensis]GCE14467.1 hypothetical protein KTT_43260 [Tengunoibacter tsumagoiensis]
MATEQGIIGKEIGNYKIVAKIATGGFGTVYRAQHHILTERTVAIKILHTFLGSEQERQQFIQEAQFLEQLRHPYILSLLDVGFTQVGFGAEYPYLLAIYAAHGSLRERLKKITGRTLPWDLAENILTQVGQALQHAHQQKIIHRDLKPDNILFTDTHTAVLADFGIATVLSTGSIKYTTVAGTPLYMSPEQFRGSISRESDQYSLGCIAYELATGKPPFSAPDFIALGFKHATEEPVPPQQINPLIPDYANQAILKAIAKERRDRHEDVAAFIAALQKPKRVIETPSIVPQKPKELWLEEGKVLYQQQRYEESLFPFEQAIRIDPQSIEAYYWKSDALYELQRYEESLEICEQILLIDPYYIKVYLAQSYNFIELKRYSEALAALDQALRLEPNHITAHFEKGKLLHRLKEHQEALGIFEHVINLAPDFADAYYWKADSLNELHRFKESLVACEKALQLQPQHIQAQIVKGYNLSWLKRYKEANEAFDLAILLDPHNISLYVEKGNNYTRLGKFAEAIDSYDRALRLDPHNQGAISGRWIAVAKNKG